ncbi:PREDICTED: D(4) dopamine receptor [Colobus angolensis palliatus]|uniref:D(4) dopamine receptor n=1 Tax=Colobus angolensis palliatus TaxID=336983 RepID=UPI0005F55C04|nr:PREDICTED: D(4) dopamine receptor [Colobus angolensis palliatus]
MDPTLHTRSGPRGDLSAERVFLCPLLWPLVHSRAPSSIFSPGTTRKSGGHKGPRWLGNLRACGVAAQVQGGAWLLSPRLCDALMAMDVMLCTASIFNLCAISVDRCAALPALPAPGLPQGPCGPDCAPPVPGLPPDPCDSNCAPPDAVRAAALPPQTPPQTRRRRRAKITGRERKAMRVLPVVVGAFLLCWTPFFVVHITQALCPACSVPPRLVSAVTWLGYVNSALNPVIYTVFNAEFRSVFRKALRACC